MIPTWQACSVFRSNEHGHPTRFSRIANANGTWINLNARSTKASTRLLSTKSSTFLFENLSSFFFDYNMYLWKQKLRFNLILNETRTSPICKQMSDEFGKIVHVDEMSYMHRQMRIMTQFGTSLDEESNVKKKLFRFYSKFLSYWNI